MVLESVDHSYILLHTWPNLILYTTMHKLRDYTYEKSGEDRDRTNKMGNSLEEKCLNRLSPVIRAEEQGEEDQRQVETGGENVGDQEIYKKPEQ